MCHGANVVLSIQRAHATESDGPLDYVWPWNGMGHSSRIRFDARKQYFYDQTWSDRLGIIFAICKRSAIGVYTPYHHSTANLLLPATAATLLHCVESAELQTVYMLLSSVLYILLLSNIVQKFLLRLIQKYIFCRCYVQARCMLTLLRQICPSVCLTHLSIVSKRIK